MEETDTRASANYTLVVLLDSLNYALLSISVEDAQGVKLMPTMNLELGPESNTDGTIFYPWRYQVDSPPPPSAPPPSSEGRRLDKLGAEVGVPAVPHAEIAEPLRSEGRSLFQRSIGLFLPDLLMDDGAEDLYAEDDFQEEDDHLDGLDALFEFEDEEAEAIGDAIAAERDEDLPGFSRRRSSSSRSSSSSYSGSSSSRSTSSYSGSSSSRSTSSYSGSSSSSYSRSSSYGSGRSSYASYSSNYASSRSTSAATYGRPSSYTSNSYYGGRGSTYGGARWGYSAPYYYRPYHAYGFYYPRYYYSPYYTYCSPFYGCYYTYSPYVYYYYYAAGVIRPPATLMVVRRSYYGCYSCNNCRQSCCESRGSCTGVDSYEVNSDRDRYELSGEGSSLITPEKGSTKWPLYVVVHNVTVFDTSAGGRATPGGKPVLINFYTEDTDPYQLYGSILAGLGWPLLVASLIGLCCASCMYKRGAGAVANTQHYAGSFKAKAGIQWQSKKWGRAQVGA